MQHTHWRFLQIVLSMWSIAYASACTGGSKTTTPPPGPSCADSRTHVESLYQAEASNNVGTPDGDEDDAAGERAEQRTRQWVGDNTEMMLTDCKTDPTRFVPCLKAAVSVEQMERDCLIPLDERGTVEGRFFTRRVAP